MAFRQQKRDIKKRPRLSFLQEDGPCDESLGDAGQPGAQKKSVGKRVAMTADWMDDVRDSHSRRGC